MITYCLRRCTHARSVLTLGDHLGDHLGQYFYHLKVGPAPMLGPTSQQSLALDFTQHKSS